MHKGVNRPLFDSPERGASSSSSRANSRGYSPSSRHVGSSFDPPLRAPPEQSRNGEAQPVNNNEDGPGMYKVQHPETLVSARQAPGGKEVARLSRDQRVEVLQVVDLHSHRRRRAQLRDPAGWISIYCLDSGHRWARRDTERAAAGGSSSERGESPLRGTMEQILEKGGNMVDDLKEKGRNMKDALDRRLNRKHPAHKHPKVVPESSKRPPGWKPKVCKGDSHKWIFTEQTGCNIQVTTHNQVEPHICKTVDEATRTLEQYPHKYFGCEWTKPPYKVTVRLFPRDCDFYQTGVGQASKPEAFSAKVATYAALPREVPEVKDAYSDRSLAKYNREQLILKSPGRQQGLVDSPELKLIGDVDPSDLQQGSVGDCWLLSAISALAEFDGAIEALFRKNGNIDLLPRDDWNMYTVCLWDLKTWKQVDVKVDERLHCSADSGHTFGAKPSSDGEIWPCVLEKAVAAHCGGWAEIDGGTCTHAWRLLTGCRECYTILRNPEEKSKWSCYGAYNPNKHCWEELENSPNKGFSGAWPMAWPEVGGGGDLHTKLSENDLFERMCHWHDENFIMCAGSGAGSDKNNTDGIVDGHAYSILNCIDNAGHTEFDMIQMRNPWGKGEFAGHGWEDDGPKWKQYPQVYKACGNPKAADDGIFWMQKETFFKYFSTVYLCAHDMSKFPEA